MSLPKSASVYRKILAFSRVLLTSDERDANALLLASRLRFIFLARFLFSSPSDMRLASA